MYDEHKTKNNGQNKKAHIRQRVLLQTAACMSKPHARRTLVWQKAGTLGQASLVRARDQRCSTQSKKLALHNQRCSKCQRFTSSVCQPRLQHRGQQKQDTDREL